MRYAAVSMSSAEPHVTRDRASADPAPVRTTEHRADVWVVAALLTPVAIPLLRPLGDHSTSLALRTSLLLGMSIALGAGFALLARSRAQPSTCKLARWGPRQRSGALPGHRRAQRRLRSACPARDDSIHQLRLLWPPPRTLRASGPHGPRPRPRDDELLLRDGGAAAATWSRRLRGATEANPRRLSVDVRHCDEPTYYRLSVEGALNTSSPSSSRRSIALLRAATSRVSADRSIPRAAPP